MVSSCRQLFLEKKKMVFFFNLFGFIWTFWLCPFFSSGSPFDPGVRGALLPWALQHPWVLMEMDAESRKGLPRRVIYSVT